MKLSWEGLGVILANLGGLGGSFSGHFGGLGGSWRPLGASWARLGPSWRHLGRSWRDLGSFLEVWEASWQRLGSHLGVFGEPFWGCLDRLGPEKTCKRGKKSLSRGLPILTSILEWFLIDFGSFFGPRELNSIEKIVGFPVPEGFSPFLARNWFWCDFGANMPPFWLPKSFKIVSWRRLGGHFGGLGGSWRPLGAS